MNNLTSKEQKFEQYKVGIKVTDPSTKLADLLNRLNEGEDTVLLRKEAKEFLSKINQKDLAFAEQKLFEAGLEIGDIRNLCTAHMEMVIGELEKMNISLKQGHVLYKLVKEHERILFHLDDLEKLNRHILGIKDLGTEKQVIEKLFYIVNHLFDVERHTKREEEVIFPELEQRGIYGPPNVLRTEHREINGWKGKLKEIVANGEWDDFNQFKRDLKLVTEVLTVKLRDHIYKEDNILFPSALQLIPKDRWKDLKLKCDDIGYDNLRTNK